MRKNSARSDILIRADPRFVEFIEKIKEEREKRGCKRSEKSDRWITMMIARHNSTPIIMEEIINYE